MTDLARKLGHPTVVGFSLGYYDRAYAATLKSIEASQRADAALPVKGVPQDKCDHVATMMAALGAAVDGTLSGVRHQLGAKAAEDMLRQAATDTGLDLARKQP